MDLSYTEIKIPKKKKGHYRLIEMPNDELKEFQRYHLNIFMNSSLEPSKHSHAFMRKRNVRTFLTPHRHSTNFLRMDLVDFFHSVTFDHIAGMVSVKDPRYFFHPEKGYLPQGAPTSPFLANLATSRMDVRIAAALKDCVYTRYCDDLLISTKDKSKHIDQKMIKDIIEDEGFKVNEDKTRVSISKTTICGLSLQNKKISVCSRIRRKLKAAIHQKNKQSATGIIAFFGMQDDQFERMRLLREVSELCTDS